jgi:hypothetical protein
MMSSRRFSLGLALLALGYAGVARADTAADAWNAAKASVPTKLQMVVGINLATIKNTQIFKQMYPMMLKQSGAGEKGLDLVKTQCGIDPLNAIEGVVVMMAGEKDGVVYLSTKNIDAAKAKDCLTKVVATEKPGTKVTASAPDAKGVVEFTMSGDKDKGYFAFRPNHVIVTSFDPTSKASLNKWLAPGSAAASGLPLDKAKTSAAVWVVLGSEQLHDPTVKSANVWIDAAGGTLILEAHVVMDSAQSAQSAVDKANKQMAEAQKSGQLPPGLANAIKNVKVTAAGPEMVIKASMAEAEALQLIGGFMQKM